MSKKVSNNFVSDLKRDHALDDNIVNNQLNWLIAGQVDYLAKVINGKKLKMADILAQAQEASEEAEGSQAEPDWVQLERQYQWQESQLEVTQIYHDYMKEVVETLWSDVRAKAKSQADSKSFFKKIAS